MGVGGTRAFEPQPLYFRKVAVALVLGRKLSLANDARERQMFHQPLTCQNPVEQALYGESADPLGQRRDILVKRNTLGVPEPCPERRPARKEKRAYRATHQE